MNRKIFVAILTVTLLSLLVAPAFGTVLFANNDNVGGDHAHFQATHPAAAASTSATAQEIAGNNEYIQYVTMYLNNSGSDARLYAAVWNTSGTLKATSVTYIDTILVSTTVYQSYTWNFSDGGFNLTSGSSWWIGVYVSSGTISDVNNCYYSVRDGGSLQHTYYSSAWHDTALHALTIVVQTTAETTPTLPTEGGYDWTGDTDALLNSFMGFLIPLVLILLPAALLCAMARRVDKWLIIIGLTIGSALLYLFLGPQYLWLVFLVTIGLIGMAYQSVRGGG